ncbi:MAG: hypothetical protein J0H31_12075, partial [Alphaproteobacteria bacterium]|nr:hypothetical protein [Alphaproteobacteria bacterium]
MKEKIAGGRERPDKSKGERGERRYLAGIMCRPRLTNRTAIFDQFDRVIRPAQVSDLDLGSRDAGDGLDRSGIAAGARGQL